MLLGGFSVELSVGGKLLKEFNEPAHKRTTKTGVSYVLDQKTGEKIESDQTFYAEVEEADKSYEILFGASKELFTTEEEQSAAISFKAKIFADGLWDHSWRSIGKPGKIKKDGFIGEKRRKTPLMFDVTKLEENEDEKDDDTQDNNDNKRALRKRKNTKKGDAKKGDDDDSIDEKKSPEDQDKFGHGAISVYFFNAKDIEKNESAVPLAALHLHYRSTKWLLERNILVEERSDDIFDETQATKDEDTDEMAQKDIQETKKVKPEAKRKTTQSRKGRNKKEKVTTVETTTTMEIEESAGSDCDISEWTGKLNLGSEEENKGAKKKPRGKKEKKIVEKVKNETESNAESGAKRYNLRARK